MVNNLHLFNFQKRINTYKTMNKSDLPKSDNIETKKKKLKKACEDFEAIFINEIFKSMRKSLPDDGLWGKTREKEIWEDMFYSNLSREMASKSGIGLADILYSKLGKEVK